MSVPDTTAASTSDGSSATSLENDVGAMFGSIPVSTDEESPGSGENSAEGTTPSEPTPGLATDPSQAAESAGATATTAPSDGTTPPAAPIVPVAEDDPFKDTTPATYVVEGKTIPVEDIRVFKEGGAVIRPEALPNILSKLAQRDTLEAKERGTSQQYQTLEKVVEWTDPSNKTFRGTEAAIEMRIGNASLFAENKLLVDTLLDPERLVQILTTEEIPDGRGGLTQRLVVSPQALAQLQRENTLQQRELSAEIRSHFGKLLAESARTPAPLNYASETPKLIQTIAQAASLDASVLTPADQAMLAKQLPFHVKDGNASVEWQELVRERITDRLAQREQTKGLVTATERATKEGQARMLQAARGMKPTKPTTTPVAPVKPTPPAEERAASEGELFDTIVRSGSRALRAR